MNDFKEKLYNAFAEVMYEYEDYCVCENSYKEDIKQLMNEIIDMFYNSKED